MKLLGIFLAAWLAFVSSALAQGGMGPGPGTVHATAAGYTGPGDIATFEAWGGVRAYSAAKAAATVAAIDIVDSSAANGTTINVTTAGNLDVAAINTWITSFAVTGIYVVKVYDQTGNGHHWTCSFAGCPNLSLEGGLAPSGGYSLKFGTGGIKQMTATGFAVASPLLLHSVFRPTSLGTNMVIVTDGTGITQYVSSGSKYSLYVTSGADSSNSVSANNWFSGAATSNGSSSAVYLNGTDNTGLNPGSNGGQSGGHTEQVGSDDFSQLFIGELAEWGIASTSSSRSAVADNAQTYWGWPATPYSGPGDVVAITTGAWFGLRAYSRATIGTYAARVCNASDVACKDLATLSNGNFNVTAAQAAPLSCGGAGGTCTIKTFYDQTGLLNCSGIACAIDQNTISQRATLVFNCIGSLPCARFTSAAGTFYSMSAGSNVSPPNTVGVAVKRSANFTTQQNVWIDDLSNVTVVDYAPSANTIEMYNSGNTTTTTSTDGSFNYVQSIFTATGTNQSITVDANSPATGATNNSNIKVSGILGSRGGGTAQKLDGDFLEIGFWQSKAFNGTELGNMNTNVHTYWGF